MRRTILALALVAAAALHPLIHTEPSHSFEGLHDAIGARSEACPCLHAAAVTVQPPALAPDDLVIGGHAPCIEVVPHSAPLSLLATRAPPRLA